MTRLKSYILFLTLILLCGCVREGEVELSHRECASLPSGGRVSASVCVLDGKAYLFGGRDKNGNYLNEFWQYNPQTNTWTDLGSNPLSPRVKCVCAAYAGALYIGLGFGQGGVYEKESYLRDWWKYDPSTNTWTQLADYESRRTISPVPYICGERIYTIYGTDGCFSRDITYYDVPTDTWHTEPEDWHRAKSVFGGVGTAIQGRCFFGLGNNTHNLNQWFEVYLPNDQWTSRCALPDKGRALCACCATDSYIYVFGGRYFAGELTGGEVFADYHRYNPVTDSWERCGLMPGGRAENQVAFTINNKIYFGLGENENGQAIDQLYCIEE